jgi:DMSO/TMAO reductase YedYZ molybdopterin-dependent catalytic subunit
VRNQVLTRPYGFAMELRVPATLGLKNPKHIMAIDVTNTYPGGFG